MSETALALFMLSALACAPTSSSPQHTITAAPTTVSIQIDLSTRDALVRRLEARSLDVARLIVRDVQPRAAQGLKGVRVFVEKPDAGITTPTDDPHYAGSFVLGFAPPETHLLNIAPTLSKLWASGDLKRGASNQPETIRITFVPEVTEPGLRLAPEFALTLQTISLEVPRLP